MRTEGEHQKAWDRTFRMPTFDVQAEEGKAAKESEELQKSIVLNVAQRSKERRSKISADLATWESLMISPGAVLVE